jgi:hypothetical protein
MAGDTFHRLLPGFGVTPLSRIVTEELAALAGGQGRLRAA